MRIAHWIAVLGGLGVVTAAAPVEAQQAPRRARGAPARAEPALEVAAGPAARAQRATTWGRAPRGAAAAWRRFEAEVGPGWLASWDQDTRVPSRILGPGLAAPGVIASAQAAEAFARAFLERHLDLLAPGAAPEDLVVVGNDLDTGGAKAMRTVGFSQRRRGMPVVGGQVSFRFKADRLLLVGSEALPRVDAAAPLASLDPAVARERAEAWVRSDRAGEAQAGAVEGPLVLPIVRAGGAAYRAVVRVTVDAREPIGRWAVYLDAETGAPVAREQTLRFASGTLLLDAPVRYPGAGRSDYPARRAALTVGGAAVTSDDAGLVSWPDASPAALLAQLSGPLAEVANAAGAEAAASFTLDPGGTVVWSAPASEFEDAQLSAYVHALIVKGHVKTIAPQMGWLDMQVQVETNINDVCNAFSDGTNIHFFRAGGGCENTARLADVVYHEFGHSFHAHAIIPGVGEFEGGLGEGQADYLAATITGDPGTSRGFFLSDEPLRHIDPPDREYVWPDDVSEAHETGKIISGALWDLRKALAQKLGQAEGVAHTDWLYYQGIRRAVDIPSMYPEVLAADDDDGDLANGTPNGCEIATAFGLHGIRALAAEISDLGAEPPAQDGYRVSMKVSGLFEGCPGDSIEEARISWRLRENHGMSGTAAMAPEGDALVGVIPPQPPGNVVQYRVELRLAGGALIAFPDNPADPRYELFIGETVPLYCTDFEADPSADGWTHGAGDWQWSTPIGGPGSGDPSEAYSGAKVYGNDLGHSGSDGRYEPNSTSMTVSPVISTQGRRRIRLQYRRWLHVEDGNFDQATIYADGEPVWANVDSNQGDFSSTHHRDHEWRFHDVDLEGFGDDGQVQIGFELRSDPGLELGGWTIDDLCVVALVDPRCGNGELDPGEGCDDGAGNSDTAPDACRTDCTPARCGDGVMDTGEGCDGEGCPATCAAAGEDAAPEGGCACAIGRDARGAGAGGSASGVAAALALAALRLRRRRR